jgi:hypothetical protein
MRMEPGGSAGLHRVSGLGLDMVKDEISGVEQHGAVA